MCGDRGVGHGIPQRPLPLCRLQPPATGGAAAVCHAAARGEGPLLLGLRPLLPGRAKCRRHAARPRGRPVHQPLPQGISQRARHDARRHLRLPGPRQVHQIRIGTDREHPGALRQRVAPGRGAHGGWPPDGHRHVQRVAAAHRHSQPAVGRQEGQRHHGLPSRTDGRGILHPAVVRPAGAGVHAPADAHPAPPPLCPPPGHDGRRCAATGRRHLGTRTVGRAAGRAAPRGQCCRPDSRRRPVAAGVTLPGLHARQPAQRPATAGRADRRHTHRAAPGQPVGPADHHPLPRRTRRGTAGHGRARNPQPRLRPRAAALLRRGHDAARRQRQLVHTPQHPAGLRTNHRREQGEHLFLLLPPPVAARHGRHHPLQQLH